MYLPLKIIETGDLKQIYHLVERIVKVMSVVLYDRDNWLKRSELMELSVSR